MSYKNTGFIYTEGKIPGGHIFLQQVHSDGFVEDCSNSSVVPMELLQSCTKPLILCPV